MPATRSPVRSCSRCGAAFRSDFLRCPIDGAVVAVADRDPLIGSLAFAPYVIEELLDEGSMGRVYRAHLVGRPDLAAAVKVLYGDLASMTSMRARFVQEAQRARRLDHPNIVAVQRLGASDHGLLYIAMELVEGRSHAERLADGPMAPARVIRLARGLLAGLDYAHARGLVHRDLKPANVLVVDGPDGEVPRLVDFGIALSVDARQPRLTLTGSVLGTPAYIAPEQVLDGAPVDHRADLYALGATLYELLTGILPFDGETLAMVLAKVQHRAPAMAARAPHVAVPAALEHIVQTLLQRRPADRYATARDVVAALDDLAAATPEPFDLTDRCERFDFDDLDRDAAATAVGLSA